MLQALRRARLGASIPACALAAWALAPAPALAQESSFVLPIYNLLVAPHSAGAAERSAVPNFEAPERALQMHPAIELSKVDSRFAMIELPREGSAPGTYSRPHHAFGYRWHAAESWLHERGLDAQTCYLPMMRLHSKFGANGASGTVWIYGRCAFK